MEIKTFRGERWPVSWLLIFVGERLHLLNPCCVRQELIKSLESRCLQCLSPSSGEAHSLHLVPIYKAFFPLPLPKCNNDSVKWSPLIKDLNSTSYLFTDDALLWKPIYFELCSTAFFSYESLLIQLRKGHQTWVRNVFVSRVRNILKMVFRGM